MPEGKLLVNISEIKIKRRVRKDLGDLEPLKDSLRRYGLLNPVTIDSQYNLIAGERRLAAAKAIGWTSINAVIINNVSPLTKLELELEENNQRKEFTDAELLEGYKRLEKLRNPNFFRRLLNALISLFKWIAKSVKKLFKK